MTLHVLDAEGLPPAGIERALAHHFLGRPNPLAKNILYSLIGGRRRFADLRPLLRGKSDNNLADALRLLMEEHAVDQFIEPRTRPAVKLYELSPFGLLVVDWMRRYEVMDEIAEARHDLSPQPAHA